MFYTPEMVFYPAKMFFYTSEMVFYSTKMVFYTPKTLKYFIFMVSCTKNFRVLKSLAMSLTQNKAFFSRIMQSLEVCEGFIDFEIVSCWLFPRIINVHDVSSEGFEVIGFVPIQSHGSNEGKSQIFGVKITETDAWTATLMPQIRHRIP